MSEPDLGDLSATAARLDAHGREERRERRESWQEGPASGEDAALAALRERIAATASRRRRPGAALAFGSLVAAALVLAFFLWQPADEHRKDVVLGSGDAPVVTWPRGELEGGESFSPVSWRGELAPHQEWVVVLFDEHGGRIAASQPTRENEWEIAPEVLEGLTYVRVRVLSFSADTGAYGTPSEDVTAWLPERR